MEGFRACFADLEDPRSGNAQRHELDGIVMIALLAMLCGGETCVDPRVRRCPPARGQAWRCSGAARRRCWAG